MMKNIDIENKIKKFFSDKIINGMKLKKFLKDNPDINIYINNLFNSNNSYSKITNVIWCILNKFDINNYKCKSCGKQLKLLNATQRRIYCSEKCAMSNKELINKRKNTISKDPDYYLKRSEKSKETCIKRYGTKTPAENEEIKNKIKEYYYLHDNIWNKRNEILKQTIQEKYGVECYLQSNDNRNLLNDISWNRILSWKDYIIPLFSREEYNGFNNDKIYKWKCIKCGNEFEQKIYHTNFSNIDSHLPRCEYCFPKNDGFSASEKEIVSYCKQYFNNIKENDREIISPYELDIVIPERKIAIEFNGTYWHSEELGKNINYHLNKLKLCESNGYRLINIWEYDWKYKKEIVISKLNSIFNINQERIYARKCFIKEISAKIKNNFLNKHHIQGSDSSLIKLGLFYNEELVAVMTFNHPRFNKNFEWELIRYATSKHVIGGAGKLLKYFEKKYNPKSLITYADRSYSIGNMYLKLGFKLDHISEPNYKWIKDNIILSRYQCQKHKLKSLLGNNFFNNLSETQNMQLNKFNKIYDCGNLIFAKIY